MNYRDYFKGKKVTIVGFGENNKALNDVEFLAKAGAFITVVETRAEKDLLPFTERFNEPTTINAEASIENIIKKQKSDWRKNVTFSYGKLKDVDFEDKDLIIRDISIPLNLPQFKNALKHSIPVEVAESLFIKLAPPVTFIGVTGTCGKTTVCYLVNEMLKKGFIETDQKFYFIDPYKGSSPLSLLGKIKRDDVILMELSSLLLKEMDGARISPHIAVITNLQSDHLDEHESREVYLDVKGTIFKYQTYNNFLIANDDVIDFVKGHFDLPFKAKIMRTSVNLVPSTWNVKESPYHMRENMAFAMRVAEILKVPESVVKEVVESFKGLKSRLEYVKKIRNAPYYNDSASTNAFATLTALKSVTQSKNGVLIFGGADSNWNIKETEEFLKTITQYIHTLILLPGSGTLKMHKQLMDLEDIQHKYAHDIVNAVEMARDNAGKNDVVIFSPGFPARGLLKNEMERGDQFIWALRSM